MHSNDIRLGFLFFGFIANWRWSGDVIVLGTLQTPGRPANFENSRARASALAVGAGGVVWTFFLSSIISLFSPYL